MTDFPDFPLPRRPSPVASRRVPHAANKLMSSAGPGPEAGEPGQTLFRGGRGDETPRTASWDPRLRRGLGGERAALCQRLGTSTGSQLPSPGRREKATAARHSQDSHPARPSVCLCSETLRVPQSRKQLPEIPNPERKNERNQPTPGPGTRSVKPGGQSRVLHGHRGQAALQVPAGQSRKGKVAGCGVLAAGGRGQVPAMWPVRGQRG